jgi:hypothetical protein
LAETPFADLSLNFSKINAVLHRSTQLLVPRIDSFHSLEERLNLDLLALAILNFFRQNSMRELLLNGTNQFLGLLGLLEEFGL